MLNICHVTLRDNLIKVSHYLDLVAFDVVDQEIYHFFCAKRTQLTR